MKSVYIILLLLMSLSIANAQTQCNQDINSSGGTYEGANGIINTWTVGSPIVGEMISDNGEYTICNGFVPMNLSCCEGEVLICDSGDAPNEPQPSPIVVCAGETVNLAAPAGYSSYLWEDGTQSSIYSVTESGVYEVTIETVFNTCCATFQSSQTLSYEVNFLQSPTISFETVNPTECGVNTGTINLSFTNIPDGTYDLTFKGGVFDNVVISNGSASITGLAPGIYNFITITNTAGCSSLTDGLVEILESDNLIQAPALTTGSAFCISNNVESLMATGEAFANFTWYSDATLTNVLNLGAYYLTNGANETVYVTQKLTGNCESEALEVNIVFNESVTLDSKSYEFCADEAGTDVVTVDLTTFESEIGDSNGVWTNEDGDIIQAESYQFSDQVNLQYTISNENGCDATAAVKLKVTPVETKTIDIPRCTFENGNLLNLMAIATVNSLPETGVWISNELEIDVSDFYILYEPFQIFNYNYSDENGCANKLTVNVTLEQAPILHATVVCNIPTKLDPPDNPNPVNFNNYYIEVSLVKNVTYNDVLVNDGNNEQIASGNGVVIFGPYTHSSTGLNATPIVASFIGSSGCSTVVEVLESYCPGLASCDCSNGANGGNILALDEQGSFGTNGFIPFYVLTNDDGSILSHNNTSLFDGLENNNYQVYAIQINPLDSDLLSTALTSETSIDALTQSISNMNLEYSISDPNTFVVNCDCNPVVCPEIGDLEISGEVCEGSTFDVTVESADSNTGILVGYYSGVVARPDPYNNPPDGLFNGGNASSAQNGAVNLSGMGANLSDGFYTIVAYLANPPNDSGCRPMVRKFTEIYDTPQFNLVANPICAGNSGVLFSNVTGGAFPYTISWTDPAGDAFQVQNFTVHLATAENTGIYSVSVNDAKGCSAVDAVDLEIVEQGSEAYFEETICETIPGGSLEAIINLNDYESLMSSPGGVWRDRSGSPVADIANVQLAGTSQFRFVYIIETQGNCNFEQVLIINIQASISCGRPISTLDSDGKPVLIADEENDGQALETQIFQLEYLLPNPTSSQLNFGLQIPVEGQLTYEIFDATGKIMNRKQELAKKGLVLFDLDVSNYSNGVYLLKINYGEHHIHQKFIKQ